MAAIVVHTFQPQRERRRESLFALGNGLLLVRGCPAECAADDDHYPATYRAGLYDRQASVVDGQQVTNTSLVRLPDWRLIAFRPAGEGDWVSEATAAVLEHRLSLDLDEAVSRRDVLIEDREGRRTRLSERRLVSMAAANLAAVRLELTPENWSGPVEIRTQIDGAVANTNVRRHHLYENHHLEPIQADEPEPGLVRLRMRTRQSRVEIALAARTRLEPAEPVERTVDLEPWRIGETFACEAAASRTLVVERTAALCTSQDVAVADPAEAALASLREAPAFEGLRQPHATAWGRLWSGLGFEAEREPLARAIRFHAFHILQTYSPHSHHLDLGFPARGWQEAYNGQIFWDELFAFPFLNLRFPEMARSILLYRYRRLDAARRAARRAGYRGAMYPWRSAATGEEETPDFQYNLLTRRWSRDDTRLERHVGSAIAYNLWRYVVATNDIDFLGDYGAEMLVEIARFWASIARLDPAAGRYDIRGVVGPDEYHPRYPGAARPGVDNNAYTNLMAVWTLLRARDALALLPSRRRAELVNLLNLGENELALWDDISRRMRIVFHDDGVIAQFEGFDRLEPLDWRTLCEAHPGERIDWVLEARGEDVNRYQITKQADVLMLLYLLSPQELSELMGRLGYACGLAELRRTADYYLQRNCHESSLSRVVCAGALAALDLEASWRYFEAALRTDLDPPPGSNTEEGVHLGAMAGTLDVLQRQYLGLDPGEALRIDPAPPPDLGPMRLAIQHRGCGLELSWADGRLEVRADADNQAPVQILHAGRTAPLAPGETRSISTVSRAEGTPEHSRAASV